MDAESRALEQKYGYIPCLHAGNWDATVLDVLRGIKPEYPVAWTTTTHGTSLTGISAPRCLRSDTNRGNDRAARDRTQLAGGAADVRPMRIHSTLVFWLLAVGCGASEKTSPPEPPRVAVAIAFEGSWGWLGNELYERSMIDWRYGAFQHLRIGIEAAFSELPANAETAIIAYDGNHPRMALSMGRVRAQSSMAIGQQRDYEQNIASDLVLGVRMGLDELAHSAAPRKILVVIGSGNVVDVDKNPGLLAPLRAEADAAGIETVAIVLPTEYAKEKPPAWAQRMVTISSSWKIVDELRATARTPTAAR